MCACSNKAKWPCGWEVAPAETIDRTELDNHFAANTERWVKTFEFLKNHDLKNLAVGEYEIVGREAYAIVSEYETKAPENCRFESHRKYIDLQYIIEGKEIMGVAAPEGLEVTVPYVEDIEFYGTEAEGAKYEEATPEKFLVFFPDQPHRPCISCDGPSHIKKVVVKILY
ncbi:MAG: YhcH/YjgK/YiaL family protein [Bacteroidales bacterium]|nr:YhcH/YjgK/YiaL family protein [Bacteroidales bacterium]